MPVHPPPVHEQRFQVVAVERLHPVHVTVDGLDDQGQQSIGVVGNDGQHVFVAGRCACGQHGGDVGHQRLSLRQQAQPFHVAVFAHGDGIHGELHLALWVQHLQVGGLLLRGFLLGAARLFGGDLSHVAARLRCDGVDLHEAAKAP